jgi:hypothetical protein
VGVGVTPSAWSGFRALQVGGATSIWSSISGNNSSFYSNNVYYNGSNRIRLNAGYATEYIQDSSAGSHIWFNAASSTAGSTITFTQAMTLDASNNLALGLTSANRRLEVSGASSGETYQMRMGAGAANSVNTYDLGRSTADGYFRFYGNQSGANGYIWSGADGERARIDISGNLLVGTTTAGGKITVSAANGTTPMIQVSNTTSGNAAGYSSSLQTAANNTSSYHYYGSTLAVGNWYLYGNGTSSWSSDERLKHNIQTTRDGYLEDVCKLRVVKYQWKNGPQQTELGLIAQEVEQVFPGLVQDDLNQVHPDDPILYKQLKGSVLPMILLKSIQELSTLITAQQSTIQSLTARLTALENK